MNPQAPIRFLIPFLLVVISYTVAIAQSADSVSIREAINDLERSQKIRFFFRSEWINNKNVIKKNNRSLNEFLSRDLSAAKLTYTTANNGKYIFIYNGPINNLEMITVEDLAPRANTTEQVGMVTLRGKIEDSNSHEAIQGATIVLDDYKVTSDKNGIYSIAIPSGPYHVRVTAVGKALTEQNINLVANTQVDFEMFESSTQLETVTITSTSGRNISSSDMSMVKIDIKTMQKIPQFMGEVDITRSLLLMPGVATVGEGASGFNVRGGNVDQNLILLDEMPLFNSSHLFGFFSTFNPDFVKDVTLLKGGMPSNYGGRIASVLDVKTKDGDNNKISASGGLGIISSRLMVEGPLSSKTTFAVGGRFSYPNWIIKKIHDPDVRQSSSYFYDANVKIKHTFNDRNNITFSGYRSTDQFKFAADTTYGWTTTGAALKWNTTITKNLVANVNGFYSNYQNNVDGANADKGFNATFGVITRGGKVDFTYFLEKHKIDFGVSATNYDFNRGHLVPTDGSVVQPVALSDQHSLEKGYYISDEWKISSKVSLTAGVRFSQYDVLGGGDVYQYKDDVPRTPFTIVDTLHFKSGERVKQYHGVEPRAAMRISLNEKSSVKLSYNRNFQYLQLISNTTAVSPLDLWRSSDYNIKPQQGDQVAGGYFVNLFNNKIEFSAETYYKWIQNMAEYKNGAQLFFNPTLEAELLPAKGKAYGIELYAKKNSGRLTGWISYTYARTLRLVNGPKKDETINNGQWYPSNFDKPHNLSAVSNYAFSRRVSLSANFTYSTGRPVTYPTSVYVSDGYTFSQFAQRNQGRIPDYHRLDLSLTVDQSLKRSKKWKGSWTLSVYNVYARKNPYSVFFKPQGEGVQTQAYRLAIIGTAFPAITYNFKI